jgi:hypothetical protein
MHPKKAAKGSKSDSPAHGTYIYVDDFIRAAVESKYSTLLGRMTRGILHGIHSVFLSPAVTGHTKGKDPISVKKLQLGNGQCHHEKELLGLIGNGDVKTVRISEAKSTNIVHKIWPKLKKKKWVPLKCYRCFVGKLWHVALIMPSTKGKFSLINKPAFIGHGKDREV